MRSILYGPLPLIVAALVVVGILYAWSDTSDQYAKSDAYSASDSNETGAYANSTYGFSLSYPADLESEQLAPDFVEIGQNSNGTFSQSADVAVLSASVSDPVPSYSDFVQLSARLACNVSGTPSVQCGDVSKSATFTTASGVSGTELYFDSNAGVRGPFYAFDVTNNVPNASYAALLIYPPPQLAASNADESLLQQIASSLQVAFK